MYQLVRGTYDLLPADAEKLRLFLGKAVEILEKSGFSELETPILEDAGLFNRSVGEGSDIVRKEMYTFTDRKGRLLALRPEGTAPIVRACLEHNLLQTNPSARFYYFGPMFRYDRPQSGRYRQFLQLGVEAFASAAAYTDAEIVFLLCRILTAASIGSYTVEVNSLGCRKCQENYGRELVHFLQDRPGSFCPDCQQRLQNNPLRIFDCKVPDCRNILKEVPTVRQGFCPECVRHFDEFLNYSRIFGVPLRVNERLVRGLDYYTRTVWEVLAGDGTNAVAAGGRYNDLVADLDGPAVPALGFAVGLERLLSLMPAAFLEKKGLRLIFLDRPSLEKALELLPVLREALPVTVTVSPEEKGLKNQLHLAGREGYRFALIIGPEELAKKEALVRNLDAGTQEPVSFETLVENLKLRFNPEI